MKRQCIPLVAALALLAASVPLRAQDAVAAPPAAVPEAPAAPPPDGAAAASAVEEATDPGAGQAPPQVRVLVLLIRDKDDREAWSRGLGIALARSPLVSGVLRSPSREAAFDEALRQDCALVLEIKGRDLETGEARIEWRFEDPLTKEPLAEGEYKAPAPTERDLAGFLWDGVLAGLAEAAPRVRYSAFTILGPAGATVRGFGKKALVVPEGGALEVLAEAPVTYRWRASVPGAYPSGGTLAFLGTPGTTLRIEDDPLPAWSFDAGLLMGQFLELRADYRFLGDALFAGGFLTSFSPGLLLSEARDPFDRPPAIVALPLAYLGARIGAYLSPPDADFRLYASAGAFVRVMFPEWRVFRLDPVAPVGFLPSLGLEYGLPRGFRFFGEVGPYCFPWSDGYLVAASRPDSVLFAAPAFAVEYPSVRFGVRFIP